jgi:hypothetical protein
MVKGDWLFVALNRIKYNSYKVLVGRRGQYHSIVEFDENVVYNNVMFIVRAIKL